MKTYRLVIELESPFATPMQSDTLSGQFVWMLQYKFGGEAVNTFMEKIKNGSCFAVSAGFPHGKIPIPYIAYDEALEKSLREVFDEACKGGGFSKKAGYYFSRFRKEAKKNMRFADFENFSAFSDEAKVKSALAPKTVQDVKTAKEFIGSIEKMKEFSGDKEKSAYVMRNTINRLTGATVQGALFETKAEYNLPGSKKDIYVRTDLLSAEETGDIFKIMGNYAFGADASTGKGRFKVLSVEEVSFFEGEGAGYVLTLGSCIPKEDEITLEKSYYSLYVKRGKMGGLLAGGVNGSDKSFFKVPLIMVKEGALLSIKLKKDIYGKIETKVNNFDSNIVQNAMTFGPLIKL